MSPRRTDLVSLAVLYVSVVATALALVGIAVRETSPLVLIPPTVTACWAILNIRS